MGENERKGSRLLVKRMLNTNRVGALIDPAKARLSEVHLQSMSDGTVDLLLRLLANKVITDTTWGPREYRGALVLVEQIPQDKVPHGLRILLEDAVNQTLGDSPTTLHEDGFAEPHGSPVSTEEQVIIEAHPTVKGAEVVSRHANAVPTINWEGGEPLYQPSKKKRKKRRVKSQREKEAAALRAKVLKIHNEVEGIRPVDIAERLSKPGQIIPPARVRKVLFEMREKEELTKSKSGRRLSPKVSARRALVYEIADAEGLGSKPHKIAQRIEELTGVTEFARIISHDLTYRRKQENKE